MRELPFISIGGGGSAFALELARNGAAVMVLERHPAIGLEQVDAR